MANKTFTLKNLPVKYKVPDMRMVSLEDLDIINESRLWFEICMGICLALFGSVISSFNFPIFITGIIFFVMTLFFFWRFKKRYKKAVDAIK